MTPEKKKPAKKAAKKASTTAKKAAPAKKAPAKAAPAKKAAVKKAPAKKAAKKAVKTVAKKATKAKRTKQEELLIDADEPVLLPVATTEEQLDEEGDELESLPTQPAGEPQRLQKILAHAGVASRRRAEEMITEGRVQVNGKVITELGAKADPKQDHIRVDGKLLQGPERLRYYVLNKPRGYVTTVSDPEGRPTVMEFVEKLGAGRVYPVGRLDYLSEGLLLLTNDGDLAHKLTQAASGVEKVYLVKVAGNPSEEALEKLRQGVMIERGKLGQGGERVRTASAEVSMARQGDNPWFEVVLIEGRNREIRKMFEEIGHHVEKIRRVGYGPLVLDVEPGKVRELEAKEVEALRLTAEGKLKPKRQKLVIPPAKKPQKKVFERRSEGDYSKPRGGFGRPDGGFRGAKQFDRGERPKFGPGEKPFEGGPKPAFNRDGEKREFRPKREGGFGGPRKEGGFKPQRREGGFGAGRPSFAAGDKPFDRDSKPAFNRDGEKREFRPKREGGFGGPRKEGGFKPQRREGGFGGERRTTRPPFAGGEKRFDRDSKPAFNRDGEKREFRPKREGGFGGPRKEGGFKPQRREGGEGGGKRFDRGPKPAFNQEGGKREFRPKREGSFGGPRREGGFNREGRAGGFGGPRKEGGFKPKRNDGEFKPQRSAEGFKLQRREGGFKPAAREGGPPQWKAKKPFGGKSGERGGGFGERKGPPKFGGAGRKPFNRGGGGGRPPRRDERS